MSHIIIKRRKFAIWNIVGFWWFGLRKKLFLMVKSVRHYYEVRVENKCIRQYLLCCQKVISSSQNGFPNHIGTPNQPKHVHKYPKQITSCSTKPPISYCIGNWMPHFIKCYLLCKVLGTKRRFLDHKVALCITKLTKVGFLLWKGTQQLLHWQSTTLCSWNDPK